MVRENDFSIHRMRCDLKLRNSSCRHFILAGFDRCSIIFGIPAFRGLFEPNPARKRSSPLTGQVTALFRSVAFLELLMSVPEKDVQRSASTSRRNFLLAPVVFGAGAILSQVLPFQEASAQTAEAPQTPLNKGRGVKSPFDRKKLSNGDLGDPSLSFCRYARPLKKSSKGWQAVRNLLN
jgi:hypothetical protein